ncbi:MAG: fdrA domain protein [Firmicutes bacterium]|nr:fdrA domain protein [Bacillota bacterium]
MTENNLLREVQVINVGLESFYESLKIQEADVINIDWAPPAIDDDIMNMLSKIK